MKSQEARQWFSATVVHSTADTSVNVVPAKSGYRFFMTSYMISVSVAAAQAIGLTNTGLTIIYFEAQGSVIQSHPSPEFFRGIQVPDNQGVSTTSAAIGPRFSCTVEGYYEPINV